MKTKQFLIIYTIAALAFSVCQFSATLIASEDGDPNIPGTNAWLKKESSDLAASIEKLKEDHARKVNAAQQDAKSRSDAKIKESDEALDDKYKINGHVEMRKFEFVLKLPNITTEDKKIYFQSPVVEMEEKGVSLNVPVLVMNRTRGPDIISVTTEWTNEGILGTPSLTVRHESRPTWIDTPTIENRLQEYRFSVPKTIKMETHELVVRLPSITFTEQRVAFDHPVFIVDDVQVGRDHKKAQERAEEAKTINEEENTRENAAAKELQTKINQKISDFLPATMMVSYAQAVNGFEVQAKAKLIELRDAEKQKEELVKQGVLPGDPRRRDLEGKINTAKFFVSTCEQGANSAWFDAATQTFKQISKEAETSGITVDQLKQSFGRWGLPTGPFEIKFTISSR